MQRNRIDPAASRSDPSNQDRTGRPDLPTQYARQAAAELVVIRNRAGPIVHAAPAGGRGNVGVRPEAPLTGDVHPGWLGPVVGLSNCVPEGACF